MGYYDIEAARLWEARVTEIQSKVWIDRPDFDKALEIARGKFAQLAPADLPAPAAVASPPPPVRAVPPTAPRAPLDAESVPSIEELLARLKSKSVAAAPVVKPAEEVPARPPRPEPLTSAPGKTEPAGAELLRSEPPKPSKPELGQIAPDAAVPLRPEARRAESPGVESLGGEPAKREAPKPELSETEPIRSEAPEPPEARQAAPVEPEAPTPPPSPSGLTSVRRPAWPVFDRKIAGSGRFVHPWRVASARWQGPGLPPRS
ncbi:MULTISPECIES: hypothetical protein [unclassified Bradyrhizobium]|uniref:hypothetical protein n=1 Tax=unclassified Bradyrhizobium TaxID=2631580 RepID=UPI001BA5611C|nr:MULTISPECIES: hypothetical protein [unclassified Bradyrhizobium]MBR1206692.1 hypothetical protein [Bradyrhizobium sp. AUGA SZCCT0124]MBR1344942.1 hypothetical protein [Bradyrhizobium sp. AUGA SZCCT0105]MBR1356262.1 hypothetical protein [Bradyrhizobium sp. AUGA SZCCT0045]